MPDARLDHDAGGIARITIARIDRRNAFDSGLVALLTELVRTVEPDARAVVLQSEGTVFCAGADLRSMLEMADAPREENLADANALAELFAALDALSMPLLARVQGPAIGGGVGLVAVCDIAIASTEAYFAFGEVRVGIVPGVVAPYVVRKVGPAFATAAFVTGERFDAHRAYEVGLVHRVVEPKAIEIAVDETLAAIHGAEPSAVRAAKRLVRQVTGRSPAEVRDLTVRAIADIRATDRAREGMKAFMQRKPPSWSS